MEGLNMLSKEAIHEFQKLYKEEFGTELPAKEASVRAFKFLRLFKLINKPIPKSWVEETKKVKKKK